MHPTLIAYKRLRHARENLEALYDEVRVFMEREPFRAVTEDDRKQGSYIIRGEVREEPPARWGLIAGDVIHGIRASLDNLFWAFAQAHENPVRNGRARFPIYKDRDVRGAKSMPCWKVEGVNLLRSVAQGVGAVIESVQPFNNGDPATDPLWVLDRLWNDDKHKRVHVVGASNAGLNAHIDTLRMTGGFAGPYSHSGPFQDGDILAGFDFDPAGQLYFEGEFQIPFYVAFAQEGPARGAPFPNLLLDLLDYTTDVVVPRFRFL